MARGRRQSKREAAELRTAETLARADQDRSAREELASIERRILRRWGSRAGVLDRLSNVSRELERLHRDEAKLLTERDELVTLLRSHGLSWNALSSRTRLSRQALMKRSVQP